MWARAIGLGSPTLNLTIGGWICLALLSLTSYSFQQRELASPQSDAGGDVVSHSRNRR